MRYQHGYTSAPGLEIPHGSLTIHCVFQDLNESLWSLLSLSHIGQLLRYLWFAITLIVWRNTGCLMFRMLLSFGVSVFFTVKLNRCLCWKNLNASSTFSPFSWRVSASKTTSPLLVLIFCLGRENPEENFFHLELSRGLDL